LGLFRFRVDLCRSEPEIKKLFSALIMLEQVGSDGGSSLVDAPVTRDGSSPKQIGEYRILREVGRGGMGVVYEAEQESLGRHVALKVLPFAALMDPNHLKRFQREARAAARLHHDARRALRIAPRDILAGCRQGPSKSVVRFRDQVRYFSD
jgi:serine/threonine protein kinase